jgi:hypothetical protein
MDTRVETEAIVRAEDVCLLAPAEAAAIAVELEDQLVSTLPVDRRLEVLGLIVRWVDDSGLYMSRDDYEALREKEAGQGRDWPGRSTVEEAFGIWENAVAAAFDMYQYGRSRARPHGVTKRRREPKNYSVQEIVRAFHYFRARFGVFPRSTEFEQWGKLERRLAKEQGHRVWPRIPDLATIRNDLAPFVEARRIAEDKWARGQINTEVAGLPRLDIDREGNLLGIQVPEPEGRRDA